VDETESIGSAGDPSKRRAEHKGRAEQGDWQPAVSTEGTGPRLWGYQDEANVLHRPLHAHTYVGPLEAVREPRTWGKASCATADPARALSRHPQRNAP